MKKGDRFRYDYNQTFSMYKFQKIASYVKSGTSIFYYFLVYYMLLILISKSNIYLLLSIFYEILRIKMIFLKRKNYLL